MTRRSRTPAASHRVNPPDAIEAGFENETIAMEAEGGRLRPSREVAEAVIKSKVGVSENNACMVEVVSPVLSLLDLRQSLLRLQLGSLWEHLKAGGFPFPYSRGLHHFGQTVAEVTTDNKRYRQFANLIGPMIYQPTVGTHVHFGAYDKNRRVELRNRVAELAHVLIGITAGSPFDLLNVYGIPRTVHSSRINAFDQLSTVLDLPSAGSFAEFEQQLFDTLNDHGLEEPTQTHPWVRVSLQPKDTNVFNLVKDGQPTVEYRIFDNGTTVEDKMLAVYLAVGLGSAAVEDIENNRPKPTFLDNASSHRSFRALAAIHGMTKQLRNPFVPASSREHRFADAWDVAQLVFAEVDRGLARIERLEGVEPGKIVEDFREVVKAIQLHGTASERMIVTHSRIAGMLYDWSGSGEPAMTEASRDGFTAAITWQQLQSLTPEGDRRNHRLLANLATADGVSGARVFCEAEGKLGKLVEPLLASGILGRSHTRAIASSREAPALALA